MLEGAVGAVSGGAGDGPEPDAERSFVVLELSTGDGSVLRSIRRRSLLFAGDSVMKGDPSGRYLLTVHGMVDLGKPDGVAGFRVGEDFYDLEW
ncbi:hypothetical protein BJY14_005719 [Actinomadura luteofluorescens]|uniref:Uncharacterized protein n=1 Tax=Actinomadura luteofluorescens TaxID=46163 RepID=A0A7Y9EL31_9ACTN|nr:hypothetical protein [Actinomadura luteofluorescens]NYD49736.1 hypothetical protein [Actinomadura luteofluorescens]